MDSDHLVVFEEEFPEGLIDELNLSYEDGLNEHADPNVPDKQSATRRDEPARALAPPQSDHDHYSAQSTRQTRTPLVQSLGLPIGSDGASLSQSLYDMSSSRRSGTPQQLRQPPGLAFSSLGRGSQGFPDRAALSRVSSSGSGISRSYLSPPVDTPSLRPPPTIRPRASRDPWQVPDAIPVGLDLRSAARRANADSARSGQYPHLPPSSAQETRVESRGGGSAPASAQTPGFANNPSTERTKSGQRSQDGSTPPLRNPPATARSISAVNVGAWLSITLIVVVGVALGIMLRIQSGRAQQATQALEAQIAELQDLFRSLRSPNSQDPIADPSHTLETLGPPPPPQPSNLALISAGARILRGYTTPPAASKWWKWSSSYRADPSCMLRPRSTECWPIHKEATIAIGLGSPSHLELVNIWVAGSDPDFFQLDAFWITESGTIKTLGVEGTFGGFALRGAGNVTQVILRLSDFDNLCVEQIDIRGNVL